MKKRHKNGGLSGSVSVGDLRRCRKSNAKSWLKRPLRGFSKRSILSNGATNAKSVEMSEILVIRAGKLLVAGGSFLARYSNVIAEAGLP